MKKKRKIDPGSYRPVTILGIIYELFEKDVGEQLSKYVECNNLMHDEKSFFFTDSYIYISDYILNNQDKGEYTGMTAIDL